MVLKFEPRYLGCYEQTIFGRAAGNAELDGWMVGLIDWSAGLRPGGESGRFFAAPDAETGAPERGLSQSAARGRSRRFESDRGRSLQRSAASWDNSRSGKWDWSAGL